MDLAAGKTKTVRLRNLPTGTSMAVRVVSTGKVLVALVSEKQIRSSEPDSNAPLFRAAVERSITFKVVIPESGNYFLVFSNRGGTREVEVQAQIRALAAPRKRAPAKRGDKMESTSAAVGPA